MTIQMCFSVTDREQQKRWFFCGSSNLDVPFGLDRPLKPQPQVDQVTSF